MGFFGELGSRLRGRKRVIAAVLALASIAVATYLAGAWATSWQMSAPRSVVVSAPHPDAPPPPDESESGEMCCKTKQPDKMMPGAMPMPGGAPMPSGRPMPGGMPQHGRMPMPGAAG
jgi:hypothetical protein